MTSPDNQFDYLLPCDLRPMEKENFSVGDPILQGFIDAGPERLSQAVSNFLNPKVHSMLPFQRPTFLYYPDLKSVPIYKSEAFHWVEVLESNYAAIRDECLALVTNPASTKEIILSSVTEGSVWQSFVLYEEGTICEANAAACPFTMSCLAKLPVLAGSALGYCYVSVVKPGTHITPHFGPSNVKLRCHFGLDIPEASLEELGMKVAQETTGWQNGKCLVFDDSFLHEVWCRESVPSPRIVLLLDVWHPDLAQCEIDALNYCLSAAPANSSDDKKELISDDEFDEEL